MVYNSFLQNIAAAIPHFFCIMDPDTYKILFMNKMAPGFENDGVIGSTVFDFVSSEFKDLYLQKFEEVKTTRKPVIMESVGAAEGTFQKKAWYQTTISIVKNPDQRIDLITLLAEDITERKLGELEIINKNERIKSIINNTTDIICSIDRDYNLLEFNSSFSEMVKQGYKVDAKSGMSILQFINQEMHEHLKSIYSKVLTGKNFSEIQKFKLISGDYIYNESSYNSIYDSNKDIIGICIFSKVITERFIAEQKNIAALKEKEILLAEIHHRIKNNLAMVSSLLQLQEMNLENHEGKEALAQSRKRIKSTALIHELLYVNESFQEIDLADYLKKLFDLLKISDGLHLRLIGDNAKLTLSMAMPLGLMLNELMLNSMKHSYKKIREGIIEIIIQKGKSNLCLEYMDSEGSFPESFNFKSTKTTGLTLIHTFAEQLNGKISLVCRTPPKYKIEIPLDEKS
jgi:PAS domain S-box-containing protein